MRAALSHPTPVTVAKANMRATVHRPQHADVVATRIFDAAGQVVGGRLFLGLFAAAAYNRNPRSIPLLRRKCDRILEMAGVEPDSHDGRALRNILDTWPRDELFQAPEDAILAGARRALDLTIRPRAALVVRHDPFERFVSAIAWLPRDTFDTRLRERVGQMVARAFDGRLSAFYIALGDAPLARVHYIIATRPGAVPAVDVAALEAAMAQAARGFGERLSEALAADRGRGRGRRRAGPLARCLPRAPIARPPPRRRAWPTSCWPNARSRPAAARADLQRAPGAGPRVADAAPGQSRRAAAAGRCAAAVREPRPARDRGTALSPDAGGRRRRWCCMSIAWKPAPIARRTASTRSWARWRALLDGAAEADGFNRLVLRAGLDWRECWLLRAMFRWAKQVGFPFAQASASRPRWPRIPRPRGCWSRSSAAASTPPRADRDTGKAEAAWAHAARGRREPG